MSSITSARLGLAKLAIAVMLSLSILLSGCSRSSEHLGVGATSAPSSEQAEQNGSMLKGPFALEYFASRGHLGATEYEHVRVSDKSYWAECGNLISAKEKLNRLEEGNREALPPASAKSVLSGLTAPSHFLVGDTPLGYVQKEQYMGDSHRPEQLIEIRRAIAELIRETASDKGFRIGPPEDVFSVMSGGLVEVTLAGDELSRSSIGHAGSSGSGSRGHLSRFGTPLRTSVSAMSDPSNGSEEALSQLIVKIRGMVPEMCGNTEFYGIRR